MSGPFILRGRLGSLPRHLRAPVKDTYLDHPHLWCRTRRTEMVPDVMGDIEHGTMGAMGRNSACWRTGR